MQFPYQVMFNGYTGVSLVEQEPLTPPEHQSSPSDFSVVRVA